MARFPSPITTHNDKMFLIFDQSAEFKTVHALKSMAYYTHNSFSFPNESKSSATSISDNWPLSSSALTTSSRLLNSLSCCSLRNCNRCCSASASLRFFFCYILRTTSDSFRSQLACFLFRRKQFFIERSNWQILGRNRSLFQPS